jgi:hypothetical protein
MPKAVARRPRSRVDLAERLATGASDVASIGACPRVVVYSRGSQAQAEEELAMLPERSAVAEMISDYAVIREQARPC